MQKNFADKFKSIDSDAKTEDTGPPIQVASVDFIHLGAISMTDIEPEAAHALATKFTHAIDNVADPESIKLFK